MYIVYIYICIYVHNIYIYVCVSPKMASNTRRKVITNPWGPPYFLTRVVRSLRRRHLVLSQNWGCCKMTSIIGLI